MKENQAIEVLGSLAHQARLRIVRHLIVAGDDGLTAGAIGDAIKAAPSKVSFHLSVLEQANLIRAKKVSRYIVYRISHKQMGQLLNYLFSDCCGNDSKILSCCPTISTTGRC